MKLTEIDLSSPGEVEDALHILQTILGKKPAVDVVLAPATFDAATTPAFPGTPDTRTVADVDAQIKAPNAPADPAAVFGAVAPVGITPPKTEAPSDPAAIFGAASPIGITQPHVAALGEPLPPELRDWIDAVPLAPTMPSIAAATPATDAPPVPAMPAPAIPTNGPALSAVPAPSAGVEVDSAGVAWSADLHAANKSKCKDGTWKARRGLAGDAAPAADAGPTTFAQLMPRVTAAITASILPPAELRVACESVGCSSVVQLQEAPEFVPMVWAWLRERYPALQ